MTDIEIQRNIELEKITKIAEKIGLTEEEIECYGKYKAKIEKKVFDRVKDNKNGKLILVTAMNPTPLGEGKTTVSIAIADALKKLDKKVILTLREPSLGPVFGMKGGATGGGKSQVAPMEDINLHFTGDIHAITTANNLLSAMIDNHIYFGNSLDIQKVIWKRCMDMNDRQLRQIETGLSGENKIKVRTDGFDITAASEIMAILCLSEDEEDLRRRLGNIVIGFNSKEEPIYAKDLNAEGAMLVLLKDAINPNIVQTLEYTPCIMHGGPFANIAHGCNSVRATKVALKLADYVVTEAGFGSDLGAEKFLDIKMRKTKLNPSACVCVATIKAIKYHGGAPKENIFEENFEALEEGMKNLFKHIHNLKDVFGVNTIVAINKFNTDTDKEIDYVVESLKQKNIESSIVEGWAKGSEGALDIAEKLIKITESEKKIKYSYEDNDTIKEKIEKVATKIYGAQNVEYSKEALESIEKIESLGKSNYPVCIAKTQYSFTDDPKNIKEVDNFNLHVREVILKNGAEFIVVIAGSIMTMPGLPKIPAAENINLDENGNTVGIF